GIFREAATVNIKGLAEPVRERRYRLNILQAHRLPATGVVGNRQHHARHLRTMRAEERLEPGQIHVALERIEIGWIPAFRDQQINRLRAACLDVAARGVKMRVGWNLLARSPNERKQYGLGR